MAVTINGSGTVTLPTNGTLNMGGGSSSITNLAAGGLPNDSVLSADIANDQISLAKIASGTDGELITWDASGNPAAVGVGTAGHYLKSQGAGSVPVFAAVPAGGITKFDSWRVTSNFSGTADPITNWEGDDTTNGRAPDAGNRMTESSGVFTFPDEGFWHIYFHIYGYHNGDVDAYEAQIKTTTNASSGASYSVRAMGYSSANNDDGGNLYFSANATCIFDVTDKTECKVRFRGAGNGGANEASTSQNNIYAIFWRLCDT